MLWIYGVVLALYLVYFYVRAKCSKDVHVHHYLVGLWIMLTCSYQHPVCTISVAFCNGMFLDGAIRWGFDPVFEMAKPKNKTHVPSIRYPTIEQRDQERPLPNTVDLGPDIF